MRAINYLLTMPEKKISTIAFYTFCRRQMMFYIREKLEMIARNIAAELSQHFYNHSKRYYHATGTGFVGNLGSRAARELPINAVRTTTDLVGNDGRRPKLAIWCLRRWQHLCCRRSK
jgi:hypothetical protein